MAGPSLGTPSPETGPAVVPVTTQSSSDAAEAAVVATFGYKQEFSRVVGGFASFALSFSNASVTTGTFLAIAGIFAIAGGAGVLGLPRERCLDALRRPRIRHIVRADSPRRT